MLMQEPKVEYVSIDMNVITAASCSDAEQKASIDLCDCSNSVQANIVGGDCAGGGGST